VTVLAVIAAWAGLAVTLAAASPVRARDVRARDRPADDASIAQPRVSRIRTTRPFAGLSSIDIKT
jgi:hypothetical protein